MFGARYAWLIPGWFNNNWWKINLEEESVTCTEDEMNKAVMGYIACDNLKISPENAVTVSGQVTNPFQRFPIISEIFRKLTKIAERLRKRPNIFQMSFSV